MGGNSNGLLNYFRYFDYIDLKKTTNLINLLIMLNIVMECSQNYDVPR